MSSPQATQKELADLSVTLDSERYRAERLESQINDLTELHQVRKINYMAIAGFSLIIMDKRTNQLTFMLSL